MENNSFSQNLFSPSVEPVVSPSQNPNLQRFLSQRYETPTAPPQPTPPPARLSHGPEIEFPSSSPPASSSPSCLPSTLLFRCGDPACGVRSSVSRARGSKAAAAAAGQRSGTMTAQNKKRGVVENGDGGIGTALASFIANNEDLGPIVRRAFAAGNPDALFNSLRGIAKRKEVEIEELCRLHYEEFILAVDELRGVLVDADGLKGTMADENLRLQEVATALLQKIDEHIELDEVNKNVGEALATLKICLQVTSLCHMCNKDITEGNFQTALKTLELIEKDYMQKIPLERLQKVVQKKVPMIKLYIEKKVCGEFNEWLVYIRKSAMEIGQASIRQVSLDRQKDEGMRARQREADDYGYVGFDEHAYSLDLEDVGDEATVEFDLTPVYRAYHIHKSLGLGEKFQEYYYSNRLMQLNLDMQISTTQPFIESHQYFLAQVAGFFIVEDRVLRTADGLLSDSQVETMWEIAISKVTSILGEQFSHMEAGNHHLLVKDYVSLLCASMKNYGYQTTSLLEVLDNNRDRYHELLLSDCRKQIEGVFAKDSYERMVIKNENEYNMNVLTFQLENIGLVPDLPYTAPFSSCVPSACRIVHFFIEASVSYMSHCGTMNCYDVVKGYLDKLLKVLNDDLLNLIHVGSVEIAQMVQIAGNIAILERSCDMFLRQAAQLCGLPRRLLEMPHSGLTGRALLKASQNAAYTGLITLANSKIDEFVLLLTGINWTSEETPEHANDYMNEILIYLDMLVSAAQPILPKEALFKVISTALSHISDSIITVLLSDRVKRFNINAVVGIDIDLKMLEEFADDRFHSTGLSDLRKETSFKDCLVEIRQLTNLLLSNQPESFMNAVIRENNYGSLDHKKVTIICEKFRDASDSLFGSLSGRSMVQNARKKSLDVLKRRLKDFS